MGQLIHGGGILGKKITEKRRTLDAIDLPASSAVVEYTSDEVVSNCPVTGQPDFYTVTIQLLSSPRGMESKSLKLYLQSFSDDGQFCEAFSDTIAQDVLTCTGAKSVMVCVKQKPRGGVSIEATSILPITENYRHGD